MTQSLVDLGHASFFLDPDFTLSSLGEFRTLYPGQLVHIDAKIPACPNFTALSGRCSG